MRELTIGGLVRDGEPLPPATRAALRAKFEMLTEAFSLIGEGMNAISDMLDDARELIDAGADEPVVDGDDERAGEQVTEPEPT